MLEPINNINLVKNDGEVITPMQWCVFCDYKSDGGVCIFCDGSADICDQCDWGDSHDRDQKSC